MEKVRKGAFFDRDGTLIEDVGYLGDPDGVRLISGVPELVRAFNNAGWVVVVASNQSGIARGLYGEAELRLVNEKVARLLQDECGSRVDAWYHCPHHPDFTGECDCRKPKPGMLLKASCELGIDLSRSFMFGDKPKDLESGRRAGCAGSFDIAEALVKCGEMGYPEYVAMLSSMNGARRPDL